MDSLIQNARDVAVERAGQEAQRPKKTAVDDELELLLTEQKAKIKVVGCGGGGNNTINRMTEVGITGAEMIALNTDAQDLLYTSADKKILIGKDLTKGLGAGSIPKVGEDAAKEQEHELKNSLQGADMIFITCGLGGGTGTGSAPVVAELGKKMGVLTVGVVTMPFEMEGKPPLRECSPWSRDIGEAGRHADRHPERQAARTGT
jgi:cell division protein FtsZ